MDANQNACARACLEGADSGAMDFPQILATLAAAGFEGYAVDYRRERATYYLPSGEGLDLATHATPTSVAAAFDAAALRSAIREAQTGAAGYSYRGFCAKAKAAGCAGYLVSMPGRRVVYFGRTGETHVEHFPPGP
ncbi:DUF1398 family protein [Caulobacter sp. KR2-114]|uniref:DUF1398 family protein n=1 Tax=Caulobacter sp. KR2-114 TaxID=3400912 RepID=UPI003C04B155